MIYIRASDYYWEVYARIYIIVFVFSRISIKMHSNLVGYKGKVQITEMLCIRCGCLAFGLKQPEEKTSIIAKLI